MSARLNALLGVCVACAFAVAASAQVKLDQNRGEQEGKQLAARLRAMRPLEGFTNTGSLHLRDSKGKRRQFPVVIETTVNGDRWQATYKAAPAAEPSTLVVARSISEPAKYTMHPPAPAGPLSPFAGTDFWLADLGLDFIHWPAQRVIKHEMRRSEWCWVLESTNPKPAPGAYSRVVSWVDTDSGGIVHADAFDHAGKLLKVFEPKSFEKVNGRWEVKELEIRNEQADTRTTLRFALERK
ncbi:MAG: outer membrane lipoprotein-sorting protein [Verrucomicrobia bacterium]|nr:outer membrane lipoprotein-sorting protein [Verrucomicrobiota bacterium]